MDVKVSPMGTGACPFCKKNDRCIILVKMREAMRDIRDPEKSGLEIVVYSCPLFEEKF